MRNCIIISGSPESDIDYYNNYITDSFIIAADSGWEKCEKLGIKYDLLIGDFDSSAKPDTDCETIVLPVRKNDTDTFYCVKEAIKRGFDNILILGGIGSRIDHTYTNILALNFCADRGVKACLLDRYNKITVLTDDTIIEKGEYLHFSLFSLFGSCEGLTTRGTQYDLTDYTLTADCPLAQSNSFKDDRIEIKFKSGKILFIQSNDSPYSS